MLTISAVHHFDLFFESNLVGKVVKKAHLHPSERGGRWMAGNVWLKDGGVKYYFYAVKIDRDNLDPDAEPYE